jgi:hypothetical protein
MGMNGRGIEIAKETSLEVGFPRLGAMSQRLSEDHGITCLHGNMLNTA